MDESPLSPPPTTPFIEFSPPLVGVEEALPGWKRALDGIVILVGLPFLLPVLIGIAFWIKSVSPGPLFFKQLRVGYRGRPFRMWKFRTMKPGSETASHETLVAELMRGDAPMTKLDADDPRIIPGGRLLRSLGLDELPQLLNVLRGEMSLVGPRPCTVFEFEHYDPPHRQRFATAPGLTGYWQVNGKNRTTFARMVEMDIWYARNRSLRLDLAIIGRTVPALLRQAAEKRGSSSGSAVKKDIE